jgi:hypothetical protein
LLLQRLLPLALMFFFGSMIALQQQGDVLAAMHAPSCVGVGPAELQASRSQASARGLAEVVESWHAYHVLQTGIDQPIRPVQGDECRLFVAGAPEESSDRFHSPRVVALRWIRTDIIGFTPGYLLVLLGLLAWLYPRPMPDGDRAVDRLHRATRRALQRMMFPALVVVGAVADWAENAQLWRVVNEAWGRARVDGTVGPIGYRGVLVAGWVKLIALGIVLVPLAVLGVVAAARSVAHYWRAARRQWLPLGTVIVFVVAIWVPEQMVDATRRLGVSQFGIGLLFVLAYALALTLAGARQPTSAPAEGMGPVRDLRARIEPSVGVVLVGIGLVGVSRVVARPGLAVPGVMLIALGGISVLLEWPQPTAVQRSRRAWVEPPAAPGTASDVAPVSWCAIGSWLGALVVVTFGAAIVRAAATDVTVLRDPGSSTRWRLGIALLVLFAAPYVRRVLEVIGRRLDGTRALYPVMGALAVVNVVGVAAHVPSLVLAFAPGVGPLAVVTVFLAGMSVASWWVQRASEWMVATEERRRWLFPVVLRELDFQRPPIIGFVATWAVLATMLLGPAVHDVRTVDGPTSTVSLNEAVDDWLDDQAVDAAGKAVPMVFVAGSGGGIRAAYWTAAVLDCVTERESRGNDPCGGEAPVDAVSMRRSRLFALSGISGSSLGFVEYASEVGDFRGDAPTAALADEWYDDRLRADFLSPTLASYLFNDGLNALLRPDDPVDRAAMLERAWEREWPDDRLERSFLAEQAAMTQPLLLLNGYSVDDGCRMATSALRTNGARDGQQCKLVGADEGLRADTALLATTDVSDVLCDGTDVRWSTAALLSARFPFVSPLGTLDRGACGRPDIATEVGDGGYRDPSGASPVNEMWPGVDRALSRAAPSACIVPVFVQIDNGYTRADLQGDQTVNQTLGPLLGLKAVSSGWEAAARVQSRQIFSGPFLGHAGVRDGEADVDRWFEIKTRAHPGAQAPLGWVLSDVARGDLRDQLRVNRDEIQRLRALLDSTTLSCE